MPSASPDIGVGVGVGVRVYLTALVLVQRLARGSAAARLGLTLLSVIGLASLVVPTAAALADGQSFVHAIAGSERWAWPSSSSAWRTSRASSRPR